MAARSESSLYVVTQSWHYKAAVGCHYFPPGPRLPTELQSITAI